MAAAQAASVRYLTNEHLLFAIEKTFSMSLVTSHDKRSLTSITVAAGGELPTQSAWPDCLGLRGGPRGSEGTGACPEAH